MKFIINNYIPSFFIFIFIILIDFSNHENTIPITIPNSLVLLDSTQVVVAKDGIHFFDNNMAEEYIEKYVNYSLINTNDLESLYMTQFKNEDDGYIIILIKNIIYIFDSNKDLLKSEDLNEKINGLHYCIIPYKKQINNKLNFFISYAEGCNIILINCTFDLSVLDNNILFDKKTFRAKNEGGTDANGLAGIHCLLMSPPTNLNISNDLLTCFGTVNDQQKWVFSTRYDPENNLEEIESLRVYKEYSYFPYQPNFILAKTNKFKKKALIFIVCDFKPYYSVFDYNNNFSTIYSENINYHCDQYENCGKSLSSNYWKKNLFFFEQTQEFIIVSHIEGHSCDILIIVFNSNYNIKYKGILHFGQTCYYTQSISLYYNGNNYMILNDGSSNDNNNNNNNIGSFNKTIDETLEMITIDNPTINIDGYEESNIETTILQIFT